MTTAADKKAALERAKLRSRMARRRRDDQPLSEGELVRSVGDTQVYYVGLVNASRARLDPINSVGTVNVVTGRSFDTYGSSINVSPQAMMERVKLEELDDWGLIRLGRLIDRAERDSAGRALPRSERRPVAEDDTQVDNEDFTTMAVASVPVAASKASDTKSRLAALKEKKGLATKEAAVAATGRKPKEPKQENACKCGCGSVTGKYFVPGHDARFKGWLKKVERGEMKVADIPNGVGANYKWVASADGKGKVPTKKYDGSDYRA